MKLYYIHKFSFPIKSNTQYLHCGGDTLIPLSTHFVTKSQLTFEKFCHIFEGKGKTLKERGFCNLVFSFIDIFDNQTTIPSCL